MITLRRACFLLWFIAAMFFGPSCKEPPSATRPNILLIIADDWGRNASCYRDPARPSVNDVIQTPNIDRVAREGILFRNAFYNVSSCTPSRASLVTGCYFWRLGRNALHQSPEWKHSIDPGWPLPGFGVLLREQNYFWARVEKLSISTGFRRNVFLSTWPSSLTTVGCRRSRIVPPRKARSKR